MFQKVKKVHFVGIGGIGMSGIAELLINMGFTVSGSDLKESPIVERLRQMGAIIHLGHASEYINDCDVLVYSSAVTQDNVELKQAKINGIPVIKRAEMLGELISLKETSIAVGGTHGKTSTSSMIGSVLSAANFDPTLVIGGLVKTIDTNALLGGGDTIIVEADEFDRSFLALSPTISIITNIELEHTDCYDSLEDLQSAFIQFCNATPFYGSVILGCDAESVRSIIPKIQRPITNYGLSTDFDVYAEKIIHKESISQFNVFHNKKKLGSIELQVPGLYNVINALAAIALGLEMSISFETIKIGLESYSGVKRRFEIKGIVNDIMIIDDYAHHPTEVTATLSAAKAGWNRRILAVFQPHLYTRTRDFYREFAESFLHSDVLFVTGIYPAREQKIPNITGELVANAAIELGHKQVIYAADLKSLESHLDRISQSGDMIIMIGAGNIWRFCDVYYKKLFKNYANA
ncbi:UDP-N-acetylmuramate--L-alanine ligase [Candidatus Neomarinimicrobiota bacterium]